MRPYLYSPVQFTPVMAYQTPAPTQKFVRYKKELLDLQNSKESGAVKRATYELSLMEKSCFIELNGVVHHYHDSGPGDAAETVVLIHGWEIGRASCRERVSSPV